MPRPFILACVCLVHVVIALKSFQAATQAATPDLDSMLSMDCELAPGKLIMLTALESEYLNKGMFANWYASAYPFLTDKIQLLLDVPDNAVVDDLRKLKWLPKDVMYVNSQMQINRLSETNQSLVRNLEALTPPWGSAEYKHTVNRKPKATVAALEKHCTVLLIDIDTYWVKNPVAELLMDKHGLVAVLDLPNHTESYRHHAKATICTCFMLWQPEPRLVKLAKDWMLHPPMNHEAGGQPSFNRVLRKNENEIDYSVISDNKFPSGSIIIHEAYDRTSVVLYHANWLVGIEQKIDFFKQRDMWHPEDVDKLPVH